MIDMAIFDDYAYWYNFELIDEYYDLLDWVYFHSPNCICEDCLDFDDVDFELCLRGL